MDEIPFLVENLLKLNAVFNAADLFRAEIPKNLFRFVGIFQEEISASDSSLFFRCPLFKRRSIYLVL